MKYECPLSQEQISGFNNYIYDIKLELLAVTETWFNDKDTVVKTDCTPASYRQSDCHRTASRRGGGWNRSALSEDFAC